jgi:3-oxoacyl-[acyl-carrier-protein] synthase III
MVNSSIHISPGFAVPFGEARLGSSERLNRELEALFISRETDEYRNPSPSHIPQAEMFESRFNLFRWPERCVQELRGFVLDSIARTVLEASNLAPEDLARLQMHNHTWFHVTRYAGSFVAHNHPLASWSTLRAECCASSIPVPGPMATSTRGTGRCGRRSRSEPAKSASRKAR